MKLRANPQDPKVDNSTLDIKDERGNRVKNVATISMFVTRYLWETEGGHRRHSPDTIERALTMQDVLLALARQMHRPCPRRHSPRAYHIHRLRSVVTPVCPHRGPAQFSTNA